MCAEECTKELTIKRPHGAGARLQLVAGHEMKTKCFQREGKQLLKESFRLSVYVCIVLENTKQKVILDKLSCR